MPLRPLSLLQRRLPCCLAAAFPARGAARFAALSSTACPSLWEPRRCCASTPTNTTTDKDSGKGNFFAFFALTKHPELDTAALQKLYHDLQRRVHPDQQQVQQREQQQQQQQSKSPSPCVPAEGTAQTSSTDISTYANAAYETLRSPYNRCRYLSRLVKAQEVKGTTLTPAEEEELRVEDDRRTMQARESCPDAPMSQEFLMEMLMISELIFAGDAAEDGVRRQWAALRADLDDRAVGYFQDAVRQWNAGDMAGFHHTVQEWTYVNNALENVKERILQSA